MLKRSGLILTAFVFSLAVVEGSLWIFPPEDFLLVLNTERLFQQDDLLGVALKPNLNLVLKSEDGQTYRVETNDRGLRESPGFAPDGRLSILGLGDSLLFGEGVEKPNCMLERLGAMLEEKRPGRYRAVNAGVPGYATNQEVVYYAARGETDFDPEAVILFYFINDIVLGYNPNNPRMWENIPLPDLPPSPGDDPLDRFRIWKFFKYWKKTRDAGGNVVAIDEPTAQMPAEALMFNRVTYPKHRHRIFDNLGFLCRILKEKTRANGAKLMVVYVPSSRETEEGPAREYYYSHYAYHPSRWDWETPSQEVGRVMEILDIPFVSLIPAFKNHWTQTNRSLFFNGRGHLTPEGHKIAADAILPPLTALLDTPGTQ